MAVKPEGEGEKEGERERVAMLEMKKGSQTME
jgi:hypothetical protein